MARERLAETLDRLIAIVEPAVDNEGFELVDLAIKRGPKRSVLQIIIDKKGRSSYVGAAPQRSMREVVANDGVRIDDCVRISKLLSPLLDVEDLIQRAYTLEVSSPGVNRPLRTPEHFRIATGLKVRVKTRVPVEGESFFIAPLVGADDDQVVLDVRGTSVEVPYRLIEKANIEYEFRS